MDVNESVNHILTHLLQQVKYANDEYPYETLFVRTGLPVTSLAMAGTIISHGDMDADELPYCEITTKSGTLQIEICPFGPLALLSSEKSVDGTHVKQILVNSGISVVSPDDLAELPAWNDYPLVEWLFPQRLSEALALFDGLRTRRRKSYDRDTDLGET